MFSKCGCQNRLWISGVGLLDCSCWPLNLPTSNLLVQLMPILDSGKGGSSFKYVKSPKTYLLRKQHGTASPPWNSCCAAIQSNGLAVNPLAFLACQKSNMSNILCESIPVKRGRVSRHLLTLLNCVVVALGDVMLRHGVKHIGDAAAGCDAIDSNLLVATNLGKYTDKRVHSAIGARIERMSGNTKVPGCVGWCENDSAAVT